MVMVVVGDCIGDKLVCIFVDGFLNLFIIGKLVMDFVDEGFVWCVWVWVDLF